jgi:hypothetical protein
MTLEEMIRDAHERGDLTHLSIVSVAGGYSSTFSPAKSFGAHFERDADPVQALVKALKSAKLARKPRAKTEKPNAKAPDADPLDFG